MLNTRIGYLALFSALFISSIAIYFSVAGLAAIFSAYATSIIIMGTAIELGKLVAVIWLHYNWKDKNRVLTTSLAILVLGVMFITSTGIFGYLSKSHVEQTAQSGESVAQIQRIESEIARNNAVLIRSEQKIQSYESNGSGVDASLNSQIDKEQARIESAYDRVKPVIQVQLDIIAADETKTQTRTAPYQTELAAVTQQLADLQSALSNKQIRTAQGIVGTTPDGSYKGDTEKAISEFRSRKETRRNELLAKIDSIRGTPSTAAKAAQEEITRIRSSVQSEIDEGNATIKSLRSRMGKSNDNDIESLITAEQTKTKIANAELDALTQEKFKLEASNRKMEAEVGPIKYIAEFVTGDTADANMLEKAVRWLIVLIIFVFDPFAVFLLIAAQHSFDRGREEKAVKKVAPTVDEMLAKTTEQPLSEEDKEWLNMEPVGAEVIDAEPEMPEEYVPDGAVNMWGEIPTYEDYFGDEEIDMEFEPSPEPEIEADTTGKIALTKVSDNYINYNGKVYQTLALMQSVPDLGLDFNRPVKSGIEFPLVAARGTMLLRTDETPTQLYINNGTNWDAIDKNLLNFTAYSHEYIKAIIKRVGNGEYNPELLNEAEKRHIEELLGRE